MIVRHLALATAAVGIALTLAACGGADMDDAAAEATGSSAAAAMQDAAGSGDAAASEEAADDVDARATEIGDTAELDAAIAEMIGGMAELATITGNDAEADIATAAAAYDYFIGGMDHLEKAANVPSDVLTPAIDTGWAVVDATANFQLSLEALVEGTGDADTASAAMDSLIQASDRLNIASDSLAPYTSLTDADLANLYDAASSGQ